MENFDAKVRAYLNSLTHLHAVPTDRSHVCKVCCGPVGDDHAMCYQCNTAHRIARVDKAQLADHTAFIIYALQSTDNATGSKSSDMALADMYAYKHSSEQAARRDEARRRIAALLYASLHTREARKEIGGPFEVVTVVPPRSGAYPSDLSRVVNLALKKIPVLPLAQSTLTWTNGENLHDRQFDTKRFTVTDPTQVHGSRILLIEDTWVSGANAQSAAVALKGAGATQVTVLTVARMLDASYTPGTYLCRSYRSLPPPML